MYQGAASLPSCVGPFGSHTAPSSGGEVEAVGVHGRYLDVSAMRGVCVCVRARAPGGMARAAQQRRQLHTAGRGGPVDAFVRVRLLCLEGAADSVCIPCLHDVYLY